MKTILIINGHPQPGSFSEAIASTYYLSAREAGARAELFHLYQLDFDLNLTKDKKNFNHLEPDIKMMQEKIKQADHLVFVFPVWWGTYPALLKGFIDRVFLKGFAYDYPEDKLFPIPLLKGKTARVITTLDTPLWYFRLVYHRPVYHAMKKVFLEFCGIKPVKFTYFSPVRKSTEKQRKKFLKHVSLLGAKMK